MPLYNNVLQSRKSEGESAPSQDVSKDEAKISSSASMKFLQDHLRSKKRSKHLINSRISYKSKQIDGKSQNSENTLPIRRFCGEPCDWDPQDEYDPMAPNSYEILQSDYLKAEEQRLIADSLSKHSKPKRPGTIDTNLLDALDEFESESVSDIRPSHGSAIAPPPTLQTTTIADPPGESPRGIEKTELNTYCEPNFNLEKLDNLPAAEKIMSKMGYRPGQGLGKDEQGISAPIEVEMSSPNFGKIIAGPQLCKPGDTIRSPSRTASENIGQTGNNQTRVLLLQNMVGPGEVDDDLEAETKEECTKYGEVVKCLIYEIPNNRVPDDQAVRIFVEFKTKEAASRASDDLNGRYFGGRVVKASFYNTDLFHRYELGC